MTRLLPIDSRPHYVYELIDADGARLYVGCASSIGKRLTAHAGKTWFPEVHRVEVDHFEDQATALKAERERIEKHQPIHNGTYTDHSNAQETRLRNMAARHEAGVPCGYRYGCRNSCREKAHEIGVQCDRSEGCFECVALMPLDCLADDRAADSWRWIASTAGGVYATALCANFSSETDAALAFYDGKTLLDVVSAACADSRYPDLRAQEIRTAKFLQDRAFGMADEQVSA